MYIYEYIYVCVKHPGLGDNLCTECTQGCLHTAQHAMSGSAAWGGPVGPSCRLHPLAQLPVLHGLCPDAVEPRACVGGAVAAAWCCTPCWQGRASIDPCKAAASDPARMCAVLMHDARSLIRNHSLRAQPAGLKQGTPVAGHLGIKILSKHGQVIDRGVTCPCLLAGLNGRGWGWGRGPVYGTLCMWLPVHL